MKKDELLAPGHTTCAGCGPAIAARMMLRAAGPDVIICEATGCMEVTTTKYPESSWKVPWIHVLFENAPAVASGVREALNAKGDTKTKVIAFGGDGGMIDIGFGALSGLLERGHEVLTIIYDNEAYMNTGIQRSGGTPWHASTTTTPAGKLSKGKPQQKKDIVSIAVGHHIPYAATASIAFPFDLEKKIRKALSIKGPTLIHVHAPCPLGWYFDTEKTIQVARLAVDTRMWPVYEVENGKKTVTQQPKGTPVAEYLKLQKRFRHLTEDDIKEYQRFIDESWKNNFTLQQI